MIKYCMNNFIIIEDCSPYYIRFTHPGIDQLIEYCKKCIPDLTDIKRFKHHMLLPTDAMTILNQTPIFDMLPLSTKRVSLFISSPGMYYRAHKDGTDHRISINYTILINDNKCVTNWYNDEDLQSYSIDNCGGWSRECKEFNPKNHVPIKSMIAKPGECILFNTDIFHDWNNAESSNHRIVLTLRIKQPFTGNMYFDDVKKIMFG